MSTPRIAILSMNYTEATDIMPIIISVRAKAEVLNKMKTEDIIAAIKKYGDEVVGIEGDITVGIKVNDDKGNSYTEHFGLKERLGGSNEYIEPLK